MGTGVSAFVSPLVPECQRDRPRDGCRAGGGALARRAGNGEARRRSMRVSLPVLLALALAAGPAADDALGHALARLQSRYETTRTLTADFRQSVESPTLGSPLESHGTVAFEKPNRMRWDYAAPDRQLIIGDGKTLWIYQPEEKQVIKAPLAEAFRAQTPVSFLAGLGRVERDFVASLERDEPARWVLRLVPRKDAGIGTLTLVVRKADATVEG